MARQLSHCMANIGNPSTNRVYTHQVVDVHPPWLTEWLAVSNGRCEYPIDWCREFPVRIHFFRTHATVGQTSAPEPGDELYRRHVNRQSASNRWKLVCMVSCGGRLPKDCERELCRRSSFTASTSSSYLAIRGTCVGRCRLVSRQTLHRWLCRWRRRRRVLMLLQPPLLPAARSTRWLRYRPHGGPTADTLSLRLN